MNQPVGRLLFTGHSIEGQVWNGKEWIKDSPSAMLKPHQKIETYSDFYGIRNFGMSRLLTKKEVESFPSLRGLNADGGDLYLQINHSPSLTYPVPLEEISNNSLQFAVRPQTTLLPLSKKHLDLIMDNMYTARFVIKNGYAKRYSADDSSFSPASPKFSGVPDGIYEFYYGKGYTVGFGGITSELPADHPLYKRTPENIQKLYNLGIQIDTNFNPTPNNTVLFPHRYAYFTNGDLYLLGAPILKKEDPALVHFNEQEAKRTSNATKSKPYIPFKDYGPPFKRRKGRRGIHPHVRSHHPRQALSGVGR